METQVMASWPNAVGTLGRAFTFFLWLGSGVALRAGALEDYVNQPDDHFRWKEIQQQSVGEFTVTHLTLTSQQWRENLWRHHLQIVRPAKLRNPDFGFLLITGNGDGTKALGLLKTLAQRAGAVAAVLTDVPNQPLYGGRSEDALIAYTFDQYVKSGDKTWPLLFPMVKSAARAMDAVVAQAQQSHQEKIERFVLSGASKRGWTTWLTGAADARVKGIAPMVIDMLNMKAQTQWADKVYGQQSERIHDYTDLGLIARMDEPPMRQLREWVDPYHYRQRYHIPKLLLLGTNDPYWTVDSLRHYWNDLSEPKLIFQTPNAGHDLAGGTEAHQSLAAFVAMIADRQPLPKVEWRYQDTSQQTKITVKASLPATSFRLWSADSADRDFRPAQWTMRELNAPKGVEAVATVEKPAQGFRAFLIELVMTSAREHPYKLSTEVRVVPDSVK